MKDLANFMLPQQFSGGLGEVSVILMYKMYLAAGFDS